MLHTIELGIFYWSLRMNKTVANAFVYMFKSENWYKKIGVFAAFAFFMKVINCSMISNFILLVHNPKDLTVQQNMHAIQLLMPIVTIIIFLLGGYIAKCVQSVISNNGSDNVVLPDWKNNILNNFIIGAKRGGSVLAVYCLLLPTLFLLGIPILLFWLLLLPLGKIFCTNFEFESYFKWKDAFALITNNIGLYVVITLLEIILNILYVVILGLLFYFKIHTTIIALISTIIFTYLSFVFGYFMGIIGEKKVYKMESV